MIACLCVAAAPGQRTLIVDPVAGPFHTIPPAIAAAAPGDTVLVRAGTYRDPLVIDKGIRLIGQGATLVPPLNRVSVLMRDLPAQQTFCLAGFRAGRLPPLTNPSRIEVSRCAGVVAIQDLTTGTGQWALTVTDAHQVHVARLALGQLTTVTSNTVFSEMEFSLGAGVGVVVSDSPVTMVSGTINASGALFGSAGVPLHNSPLTTTRPASFGSTAQPAVSSSGSFPAVWLDPSTGLNPGRGAPPISGPATIRRAPVPSVIPASTDQHTAVLHAGAGNYSGIAISSLAKAQPTGLGSLWLGSHLSVLVVGTIPANGTFTYRLNHGTLPPGLAIAVQAVTTTGNRMAFSAPGVVVFR